MIGTLTHLDTLISVTRHTRKSATLWLGCHSAKLDEAMRAQLAMIGTLTHSSPRQAPHSQRKGDPLCAGAEKQAEACVSTASP
jgi:hypothetical protein